MTATFSAYEIDSAPLDSRELDYLRSKTSTAAPLIGGLAAITLGATAIVMAAPDLDRGGWLLCVGMLSLIGLWVARWINRDQRTLRADVADGIKLWRDGRVHAMRIREDPDSGRSIYHVEIAIDSDPARLIVSTISSTCYEAIEKGDRVRIAYSPHGRHLLDLIDGDYRYIAAERHGAST